MVDPLHPRHMTVCPCGHVRRAHVDTCRMCDECDCPEYRGPIHPIPPPAYYAPVAYGLVED